ncbi:MAG: glutamate-cysteine ligase family protein [Candidatus Jacksonbacteria bacterium]
MQNSKRKIGVELEYPVVDKDGESIQPSDNVLIWQELKSIGWQIIKDRYTKKMISALKDRDRIDTDWGAGLLELALAPCSNLHQLQKRIQQQLKLIASVAKRLNFSLLAYAIQPKTKCSSAHLTPKSYYSLILKNLFRTKQKRENCIKTNCSIAANQINIDLNVDEAIDAVNIFNGFSGLFIALCANSPIYQNKNTGFHGYRSYLIDSLAEPKFKYRLGMPPRPFKNLSDYFSEILKINPLFIIRGSKIIDIVNNKKIIFDQYLQGQNWQGRALDGEIVKVNPQMQDLLLVQKFYWPEARLRYSFKTKTSLQKFLSVYRNNCQLTDFLRQNLKTLYLEIRPCDSAPQGEETAPAALSLGILSNLSKAKQLYHDLSWLKWRQIKKLAMLTSMETLQLYPILKKLLEIAQNGLKLREQGEEKFLEPLWRRLKKNQSPAMHLILTNKPKISLY